jgi:glycosyltransferase involved in cell wall biosynthesis
MSERCMLPVKLMEYLRVGLPVVAPDLPVIRRYFSDAMVSFFRPDDVADLSRAIEELARAPEGWSERARAAEAFFEEYSEKRQKDMYREFALGDDMREGNPV